MIKSAALSRQAGGARNMRLAACIYGCPADQSKNPGSSFDPGAPEGCRAGPAQEADSAKFMD